MRSDCPNIVDVYETYYYNDKLWVFFTISHDCYRLLWHIWMQVV